MNPAPRATPGTKEFSKIILNPGAEGPPQDADGFAAFLKHLDETNNLGISYHAQQRIPDAIACYRRVVAMAPQLAEGHYNLGSALRLNESFPEALVHLLRAVQLRPDYADAWNNLALACKNIGELDRALACFNRALALKPDMAEAHWNRSFVHLLKEDFASGWNDFEWRFKIHQRKSIYPFQLAGARWSGQPVPHATLLVHDEQGLGDTLQFMRYLPMLKSCCRKVVVETRPELMPLFGRSHGADQLIARSSDGPPKVDYDFYIPLMSLPGIFRTNIDTIPKAIPYVVAEQRKIGRWRTRLPSSGMKVGLVWSGRLQHANDRNRSCRLTDFLPLLRTPAVHFIGLQKDAAAEQLAALPPGIDFVNYGSELNDFSDTAGLLANLDLLISVDTSIVHLAGAMGKTAWVMLPFIPDWRWGIGREEASWYTSLRLFRQKRPKDWSDVIDRMRRQLLSAAG